MNDRKPLLGTDNQSVLSDDENQENDIARKKNTPTNDMYEL